MIEQIKILLQTYNLTAVQVALISILTTIFTFFITNWFKSYFDNKLHANKINTQHRIEEQKKIKDQISKYKIHLLTTGEDLNHRFWNLRENYNKDWLKVNGVYNEKENYYFHSTVYRFLCLYFWIKKTQKEMIYLDTTIASKEDLEFIKFLKLFPNLMCDLNFIINFGADGSSPVDHFYRTTFELFPDYILDQDCPKSFEKYNDDLPSFQQKLEPIYKYIDGVSPTENRVRWDRFYFLHLTTIIFLNNYGYDFQKTNKKQLKEILATPKRSAYINNYVAYLKKYKLDDNKEVKRLIKLIG